MKAGGFLQVLGFALLLALAAFGLSRVLGNSERTGSGVWRYRVPGTERRETTACLNNLREIVLALKMYAADHDGLLPPDLRTLAASRHLVTVPACPAAGRDTYSDGYTFVNPGDPLANPSRPGFTVLCSGLNHAAAGLPADFPRYGSRNRFERGPDLEAEDPPSVP